MKVILNVLFMALVMSVLAVEDVLLPQTISKKGYSVEIGRKGYLSSIKVNGKEFLGVSKKLPGGFYLCAGGIPPLKDFKKIGENSYEGQNNIAKVNYSFDNKSFTVKLTDVKKKGCLYIAINEAVKKVNYQNSPNEAPTINVTPVKVNCKHTRWLIGDTFLNISGGDRIWGPWKGYQIWELKLKPGVDRTITFSAGEQKETSVIPKKKAIESFTYSETTTPAQIPLCMIGDSITWAEKGDYWRKYLLEELPRLAFVGTHSACLGYSHAGEGGNSTGRVIGRLKNIPDCPYYSLLIGTNDTGVKDAAKSQKRAIRTADRIQFIVTELLKKKGVKKVFLCSILPCFTKNPLRDQTNSKTNTILREKMKTEFPSDKVVWVEFEKPIRAIKGWEPKIKLHPTPEGYQIIAKLHAAKIAEALNIKDKAVKPIAKPGTGVRVVNLWDAKAKQTTEPIIAGWYTLSFKLDSVNGTNPTIKVASTNLDITTPFNKSFKVDSDKQGKRVTINFFTGYEGYGYTRSAFNVKPQNCVISQILFEKTRPSKQASIFGQGSYIVTESAPSPGELIELKK